MRTITGPWSSTSVVRPRGVDHCRGGGSPWYDVVAGPVSRDWVNREIVPGADQVSFHTRRAVAVLNAVQDKGLA